MTTKFTNSQDTNTNLRYELTQMKSLKSNLEKDIRNFERQIKRLKTKKKLQCSISSQTLSTIDVPYQITEPLPPIFGSQLCNRTRPVFLTKSLPNLANILWVTRTDEEKLQEQADEALDYLYDLEIMNYYKEAKEKSAVQRRSVGHDPGEN